MATMDMIKHAGGSPANFLDVGGGASPERIATALKLVLSDPKVQAVLVNIFAGINRCDWVAKGVVQACQTVDVKVPLVVRLAGTNVEEGRKILAESGLELITAETLAEAADKAVAAFRADAGTCTGDGLSGRARPGRTAMSILIDETTPIIVQGMTGDKGSFHTKEMVEYGSNVVGGVTPGKGGTKHQGLPVFNTVKDAVEATGATTSITFVAPAFCADAIMEAADAGIRLICSITDGIPAQDMMRVKRYHAPLSQG